MASWQDEPYISQTVWCLQYGNGIITSVDKRGGLVMCNYYAKGFHSHELDEFFGCFDEKLNQWVLISI